MKNIKFLLLALAPVHLLAYTALPEYPNPFKSESNPSSSNRDYQHYFNIATDYFRQHNHESAIEYYNKSIELNPTCYQAYFNLGLVYEQKNQREQALENYQNAIKHNPAYVKALTHAGSLLQEKETAKALEYFTIAYNLEPNNAETVLGIARCHSLLNQFDKAGDFFNRALTLRPNDTNIMLEIGNNYNIRNQTEQALQTYYEILKLIPSNVSILYNIAYTLKKLGQIEQAMPYYQKVLALDPEHNEAHFSLSLAYLISGDYEKGWKEYEWRWKRNGHGQRNFSKPLWDGAPLHGKTILLHAEQGLGDTFQFIRYARIAKEQGAFVIAAVQDPLISIIGLCPYVDKVVSLFGALPQFDVHAPLMSMPYIVKTVAETIPNTLPYLYAEPELVTHWKEKLAANKKFKIGICWQGNSNYSTHFLRATVAAKSLHVSNFTPLLNMDTVTIYNLQKITGEEQLKQFTHPNLICFDNDFDGSHGRFMDTAAVMKNLDLMITIDTSIAHLSAGLGIPTWVLLPDPGDWRWLLNRQDTPWYPNMRLFRQPKSGDWHTVIDQIFTELQYYLHDHTLASTDLSQLSNMQLLDKINQLELSTPAKFHNQNPFLSKLMELYQQRLAGNPSLERYKDISIQLARKISSAQQAITACEMNNQFDAHFVQLTTLLKELYEQHASLKIHINE